MVQRGEAKLDCDEECDTHKMKQKKLTTEEEEIKKQEELRAQQVISLYVMCGPAYEARCGSKITKCSSTRLVAMFLLKFGAYTLWAKFEGVRLT